MSRALQLALCSAVPIATSDTEVPDWLHLLPVGEVRTQDKRGPYRVTDVKALMAASLPDGGKLVLDENHSTDLAAPKGGEAPARGWIVELQSRADGVWGRVEWTPTGRQKVADREYRGISPVIAHQKDGTILAIRRASLVNQPNLEGLTALHSEDNGMDLIGKIREALGLAADASDDDVLAAVKAACSNTTEAAQAALAPVRAKLGLAEGDGVVEAIVALQAKAASSGSAAESDAVTALQTELADVTNQLNSVRDGIAREKAEAFVDGAIAEGRVGVKPMRDEYIAMHMEDPERAKKLIGAMPSIKGASLRERTEIKRSGDLDDADKSVIALMGLDADKFKETRAAELGETEETL